MKLDRKEWNYSLQHNPLYSFVVPKQAAVSGFLLIFNEEGRRKQISVECAAFLERGTWQRMKNFIEDAFCAFHWVFHAETNTFYLWWPHTKKSQN